MRSLVASILIWLLAIGCNQNKPKDSKGKPTPRERKDKRDLVRRGARIFKKEIAR